MPILTTFLAPSLIREPARLKGPYPGHPPPIEHRAIFTRFAGNKPGAIGIAHEGRTISRGHVEAGPAGCWRLPADGKAMV
jgi:hypothetical protein